MHINNPDALKNWLAVVLEPICDADPSTLSRYVLALLKKDKPTKELQQCMTEQLDVFLGVETKPFLESLFNVIKSEEYLRLNKNDELTTDSNNLTNIIVNQGGTTANSGTIFPITTTPIPTLTTVIPGGTSISTTSSTTGNIKTLNDLGLFGGTIIKETRDNTLPIHVDIKTKEPMDKNGDCDIIAPVHNVGIIAANTAVISPLSKSLEASPAKLLETKDYNNKDRRRRASLRSRSRSRSRSYERGRKSRPRDRRLNDKQYRNISPPSGTTRRNYDRRGERSPRSYGRIRNRSHSGSRSRSCSPERRKGSRSMSPPTGDKEMGGPPKPRQRCRDFDEKGYCMRGETCPWDHGVDPVVLQDINNPALISIQSNAQPHLRSGILGEYNPDAPDLWNRGPNFMGPRGVAPHRQGSIPGPYPRGPAAGFRVGPSFSFPINPSVTTPLQRELISVPVVDANTGGDASAQAKRRFEPEDTVAVAEGGGPPKRKLPLNSRLGPRINLQQNCSLELRKVPRGLNSIAHLNNHFSKFGKIINIQISYDSDPEAAIVTFSTHAEANVAYRSTEAVLNNRFIKVFWHSGTTNPTDSGMQGKDENIPPRRNVYLNQYSTNNIVPATPTATSTESTNATSAITASTNSSTASSLMGTNTTSSTSSAGGTVTTNTTTTTPSASALAAHAAVQLRIEANRANRATTELIRKKQKEQVKTAVQLAHGLHKRKHDLLQEYLKQMRSALELAERIDHSDPQRVKMLSTVKELQTSIDKLRLEIASEQAQITATIQNQPPVRKSKEQQQKELLDVELELITQQQEGNDTTAIQKRLQELQRTYSSSARPLPHFPVRKVHVRPAPPGSTSVDRRPTAIHIVGFKLEDSDALLGHFKHFGEITKNQLDKNVPSLTISFTTRLHAEQAILRGKIFKDKPLQITWAITNAAQQQQHLLNQQQKQQSNDAILADPMDNQTSGECLTTIGETTLVGIQPLEEQRIEDEEEEEDAESEDRSWRR